MLIKLAKLLPPSRLQWGTIPNFFPDSVEDQKAAGSYGAIVSRLKRPSSASINGVETQLHYI